MAELTLYIKPTCSTCRNAIAFLQDRGIEFNEVRYYDEPLSAQKLAELVKKAGGDLKPFVRTKAPQYKELGLDGQGVTDQQVIAAMAEEPDLIQRPIAELGDRAIVARPIDVLGDFVD